MAGENETRSHEDIALKVKCQVPRLKDCHLKSCPKAKLALHDAASPLHEHACLFRTADPVLLLIILPLLLACLRSLLSCRSVVRVAYSIASLCTRRQQDIFNDAKPGLTPWCVMIAAWQHCSLQDQEEVRPEGVDGGVLRAPMLADGPEPLSL